ncbi:MAG: fibronectin type III domain-containing protein [Candidatus Pacebacteria bacterium]|nr:fibronectin type III domain-containing protein [Candidatus Paceibacterota bacterium]
MKSWRNNIVFVLMILISTFFATQAIADSEIHFKSIEVLNIEDGKATIRWVTDSKTKGVVYFSDSIEDLNRQTGYSIYGLTHEVVLTGLAKKKTYYFKIVAIDQAQIQKEAFVQSFSTKNMERTELVKPIFLEQKVVQTTSNATVFFWKTNEMTNAVISYWTEAQGASKAKKIIVRNFYVNHEASVRRLKASERYYFRIDAKDKSGNMSSKYFTINTHNYNDKDLSLKIQNIKPLSFDNDNLFTRRAIIEFKTNLATKVYIQYDVVPGKYKKKSVVSTFNSINHQIILSDLEPNTTYYYRIITSSNLHRKKLNSRGMSFTTAPLSSKLKSGTLVKGSDYKVYVISGNEKLWIKTAEIFSGFGYKWDWIMQVDDAILREYKEGKSITTTKKYLDGTLVKYSNSGAVYLIEAGKIRPFSSAEAFLREGYNWNKVITISTRIRYKIGSYL